MEYSKKELSHELHEQLKQYAYPIIGAMHYVHKDLGPGMPEYIYQEALYKKLTNDGFSVTKEYVHHPIFEGRPLDAFVKMDLVVSMPRGNVIIECKSIKELTEKERFQTYGYLRATSFPIALLVNFGTYPRAEIERYYYKDNTIWPF